MFTFHFSAWRGVSKSVRSKTRRFDFGHVRANLMTKKKNARFFHSHSVYDIKTRAVSTFRQDVVRTRRLRSIASVRHRYARKRRYHSYDRMIIIISVGFCITGRFSSSWFNFNVSILFYIRSLDIHINRGASRPGSHRQPIGSRRDY